MFSIWPIAETFDAEIQAHLKAALRRIAELRLIRVVITASDQPIPELSKVETNTQF
jgi:hypothetical protein